MFVLVVTCDPPADIDNGIFTFAPGMDWRYGGLAVYSCYRGYELEGRSRINCTIGDGDHGTWSHEFPSCHSKNANNLPNKSTCTFIQPHFTEITCPLLTAPSRAEMSCTDANRFNSRCEYTCESGYDVAPGMTRLRVCSWRGSWLGQEPRCIGKTNKHLV